MKLNVCEVGKTITQYTIWLYYLIIFQDEAAIRFVDASPDCDEYRPISILINYFSGWHNLYYLSCVHLTGMHISIRITVSLVM